MAEIVLQNPGSTEVQSPLIAGITEGLWYLSKVLNLSTANLEDEPLKAVAIDSQDQNKNRIYETNFRKKLWLTFPTPVIKKNGIIVQQTLTPYTIDYIGGSVTFEKNMQDRDAITVSCQHITGNSTTIDTITNMLNEVSLKSDRYKGYFDTVGTLETQHQTGESGDFAFVEKPTFAIFAWDATQKKWRNTQSIEDLSKFYTKSEVDDKLIAKENAISSTGKAKDYFSGNKTFRDLEGAVRETNLAGFSKGSNAPVTGSDTVLSAIEKLQTQASENSEKNYLEGTGEPTASTVAKVGQRYVNTSNGDWYTCTAVSSNTYTWKKGQNEITSLKNPNALTISLNGTSQGAYDGSSAKSINVTPAAIGAATSSHTQAASTITGLTANRALVSDASGHPAVSAVTNVELGYLAGVKSNIQNQIDSKVAYSELITKIKDYMYPIGSIFEVSPTSGSPDLYTPEQVASYFGFGTWELYGKGRVTVGIDSEDSDFALSGKTGGEKTHTLNIEEMPIHSHAPANGSAFVCISGVASDRGITGSDVWNYTVHGGNNRTEQQGKQQPHNNLQPYVVVYRYRRIA